MNINLGTANVLSLLSGETNILTISGNNNVVNGSVAYQTIENTGSSRLTVSNGENPVLPDIYNTSIIDLNSAISNIGILEYTFPYYTNIDIGSISSALTPLPPGNYLFENLVTFNSTLYLSGNGQYVFYLMLGMNVDIIPEGGYMNLSNGANSGDIFFYSPYDINFSINFTGPSYGNFISDLNIIMSSSNSNIYGRLLSSTGNITISNLNISNIDATCYNEDSFIQLSNKLYKKIKNLTSEDKVLVYGIFDENMNYTLFKNPVSKSIIFLGKCTFYNLSPNNYPISFCKNSLNNDIPFTNLKLSPNHRLLHNKKSYCAKNLLKNDIYIYKTNKITYYHLECEKHFIINVNGILTETFINCDKDSKNKFERIF